MNHTQQIIQELAQNPKTAAATGGMTLTAGFSTAMEMLPVIIGITASALGALASLAVIISIYRRDRREAEEHRLKMAELKEETKED